MSKRQIVFNALRPNKEQETKNNSYHNQVAKKRRRSRSETNACLEEEVKVVRRCIRRRIELRINQEKGFSSSGDGTKRLRTHVWGSRALLKWFKQEVLIHDASYHVPVQLEGPEDSLILVLKTLMVPSPSDLSETSSCSVISGAMYGSAMLHHVGAPLSQQNRDSDAMDHDGDGCDKLRTSSSSENSWQLRKHSAVESDHDSQLKKSSVLENEENFSSHVIVSLRVKDPHRITPEKKVCRCSRVTFYWHAQRIRS
ncbi:hypothetical protein CFP56_038297 [Quercus suber]|uniref:Uncharacterized protein n=1 Tax=Quercus suber TaxID=58331 RepID=A0AAW0LME4_QUESU